jgi:hypothetical protein
MARRGTKRRQGWKTHYLRWSMARRRTKRRQGWKTHYLRWSMARRSTKKEAGLENALPKVVDGSKVH